MPEGVARQRCRWARNASALEGRVLRSAARPLLGAAVCAGLDVLESAGVEEGIGSPVGRSAMADAPVSGADAVSVIFAVVVDGLLSIIATEDRQQVSKGWRGWRGLDTSHGGMRGPRKRYVGGFAGVPR